MGNIAYDPGSRRVSKTTRAELKQYEEQAKEGAHFDKSSMIRVGLYLYPSAVFPLRNGKKALINGYPKDLSLELITGKLAEETLRAANPEHSNDKKHMYQSTGDAKLDIKLNRRIETFKTYPIASGDLLQIAFIGFNYRWSDEENIYVDFFKNKKGSDAPALEVERLKDQYAKVPTLMYEVVALDPMGEILRGKAFQGEVRRGRIPENIGEALSQAENLGEFELPDKRIVTINEILDNYEIINIYTQIQIHIKYSDKEKREEAEYQGIEKEKLSQKEDFFSDFLGDLKNEPAGRLAQLAETHKGDTETIETDYSALRGDNIDPHAETSYIDSKPSIEESQEKTTVSFDIMSDPAFWNLLKESSEDIELSQEDHELLDSLKKSAAEVIGSNEVIDPQADTQYILPDKKNGKENQPIAEVIGSNEVIDPHGETKPAQPPKDYWEVLNSIPELNPIEDSSNQEEKKAQEKSNESTRIFKSSRRLRFE